MLFRGLEWFCFSICRQIVKFSNENYEKGAGWWVIPPLEGARLSIACLYAKKH